MNLIPHLLVILLVGVAASPRVKESPADPQPVHSLQTGRWEAAAIRPEWVGRLDKVLSRSLLNRSRYEAIEASRPGGVPWLVIAGLHERESSQSWTKHLHNGDSLTGRTYRVPAGRIPGTPPPYTFEQSAEDALYVLKRLDRVNWRDLDTLLQTIEAYNGLGYQKYHPSIPSPYLWSGTTIYDRGKYVADGKFSATAFDAQIGVAALLKHASLRKL